ncbi:S1C family serine protease [Pseudonocardia sp. HH130630-07]|uniref:S1C family serine protease n=1 Tax=Pseudonocardia sp. HH130630-07 TaxID=1690815 RepID=UPI001E4C76FE|nr:trypsin-like peptidase domain-containing protein [Pseudonocardia sp. HH130630-07]
MYPLSPTPVPAFKLPRRFGAGLVAVMVAAGLIGGGAGFGGAYAALGTTGSAPLSSVANSGASAQVGNGTIAGAAAAIAPSTVDIRVRAAQGTIEGSGVVLTSDGAVLTNNHLLTRAGSEISVSTADGTRYRAKVVGTSPSYDLAVIRLLGASNLKAATFGEASSVQVGQQVVATGSPQGLSGTVTAGIVSALNRTVTAGDGGGTRVVYNGLQTDAPINRGNSGGPLVNLAGQVIGINSAIATTGRSPGSIGLGFAVPVNTAKRVAQELMSSGVATKPQLGVQGTASPARHAENSTSNKAETSSEAGGARVDTVQSGTPAATAGVKTGDVITKIDNYPVADFEDLIARVGNFTPGQQVTLTIGSNARQVPVKLGNVQDTETANVQTGPRTTPENPGWGIPDHPRGPGLFGVDPFRTRSYL